MDTIFSYSLFAIGIGFGYVGAAILYGLAETLVQRSSNRRK